MNRVLELSGIQGAFYLNDMKVLKSFDEEIHTIEGYPHSHVYFIACDSYVKIGKAQDPEKRLAELRTGNPFNIGILYTIPCASSKVAHALEQSLHSEFDMARLRINGEWFIWAMCIEDKIRDRFKDVISVNMLHAFWMDDDYSDTIDDFIEEKSHMYTKSVVAAEIMLYNAGFSDDSKSLARKLGASIAEKGIFFGEEAVRYMEEYVKEKKEVAGIAFITEWEYSKILNGEKIRPSSKDTNLFFSKLRALSPKDMKSLRQSLSTIDNAPDFHSLCWLHIKDMYSNTDIKNEINRLAVEFGIEGFTPLPIFKKL